MTICVPFRRGFISAIPERSSACVTTTGSAPWSFAQKIACGNRREDRRGRATATAAGLARRDRAPMSQREQRDERCAQEDEQPQRARRSEPLEQSKARHEGAEHRSDDVGGLQPAHAAAEPLDIALHGTLQASKAETHHHRRRQDQRRGNDEVDDQVERAGQVQPDQRLVLTVVLPERVQDLDTIHEADEHRDDQGRRNWDRGLEQQKRRNRRPSSAIAGWPRANRARRHRGKSSAGVRTCRRSTSAPRQAFGTTRSRARAQRIRTARRSRATRPTAGSAGRVHRGLDGIANGPRRRRTDRRGQRS